MTVDEAQNLSSSNLIIFDSFEKAKSVLTKYTRISCSISGGRDSDIMLDLITKVDSEKKVRYIWFDTGIEYRATKDHLDFLEQKYNIVIERIRAIKTVPISVKEYGQPFLSKRVSNMICCLQSHNFQWEDAPLEELKVKYPRCVAALRWWCNDYLDFPTRKSSYNISYSGKYLKQFLISTPHSRFLINVAHMLRKMFPNNL